jgi:hypothetical protein
MIFLQVVKDTTITWRTNVQDANQIAQIIGTVLLAFYVIYTYRTFRQIKKQTDYQQDAYLKAEDTNIAPSDISNFEILDGKIRASKSPISSKYIKSELSSKWIDILKPHFKYEDSLFEGNLYTLVFTNYGNSEVNKIIVKLTICVSNSKELIEKKLLQSQETNTLVFEISEIIGRNGGQLKIPLLSTASFPIYSISVQGEYYDVRTKKYNLNKVNYSGENTHFQKLL